MNEKSEKTNDQKIYSYQDKIILLVYFSIFIILIGSAAYTARKVIFRPWTIRAEISAVSIKDNIYIFGGRDTKGSSLDEVLHINVNKKSLKKAGRLPVPCSYNSAVYLNDMIYILGGYGRKNSKDHIIAYDPSKKESKIIGKLPTPLAFGATIAWKDRIYYLGGWNDSIITSDIVEIDPYNGTSKIIGSLEKPREYFSASVYKNKVYLIGGEDDQFNSLNEIVEIDPVSWSVLRKVKFPYCPTNTSTIVLNGNIYTISGWDFHNKNEIIQIKPSKDQIVLSVITSLPQALSNPIMVTDQNVLLVIGGVGDDTGRQLGLFRITPPEDTVYRVKLKSYVWW